MTVLDKCKILSGVIDKVMKHKVVTRCPKADDDIHSPYTQAQLRKRRNEEWGRKFILVGRIDRI